MLHGIEGHEITHALEDLPGDARAQLADVASLPDGVSLRQRIRDELENAGLDSYGELERVPLLRFLSDYPVTAYTYVISPALSRGERPNREKLSDLYQDNYRTTINLCAEMTDGDSPLIEAAGLAGQLATYHVPVVDMNVPTEAQLTQILDLLTRPGQEPAYVHCEAGKGRTGVVTACYRLAVMGWSVADALAEAKNFGCIVPMQQAAIEDFGKVLQGPGGLAGRYPVKPLGSVQATDAELTATVASCAHPK